jgi:hypothetical protein
LATLATKIPIGMEAAMRQFQDSKKRSWTIDLTIGRVRKIRSLYDIDLAQPELPVGADGKPDEGQFTLSQRIAGSLMLVVDLIFYCISEQAAAQSPAVDVDDFCEALTPEFCKAARQAFLAELEDFFQKLGRGDQAAVVRAAIELEETMQQKRDEGTVKLKNAARKELISEMDKAIDKQLSELTSGNSSTNSPASSASTPTSSPSDDSSSCADRDSNSSGDKPD